MLLGKSFISTLGFLLIFSYLINPRVLPPLKNCVVGSSYSAVVQVTTCKLNLICYGISGLGGCLAGVSASLLDGNLKK